MIEFNTEIEAADGGGALVVVPTDVVDELGGGGRIPVRAELGGIPYRGSIATFSGRKVLGVLKAIREELGVGPGDEIVVRIERDSTERIVTIPTELAEALETEPAAREAFDKLSYTHRREHVIHITQAKRPETRRRRAAKTIERLLGD